MSRSLGCARRRRDITGCARLLAGSPRNLGGSGSVPSSGAGQCHKKHAVPSADVILCSSTAAYTGGRRCSSGCSAAGKYWSLRWKASAMAKVIA